MDYSASRAVLEALEEERVQYALFGAGAMNLLGLARFTEDLDLFVAPTEENIERMCRALRTVFDDPNINEITAEDLLGEYPAVQYIPPEGAFRLDILTRLGEAFTFADLEVERVSFEGLTVSVASARTLYRMTRDTVRLEDRADAALLRERFRLDEES